MECPHCNRTFSRRAGLRHIEKCKDIKAKPAPIRRTKTIHFKHSNIAGSANSSSAATASTNRKKPSTAPVSTNSTTLRTRNRAWEDETDQSSIHMGSNHVHVSNEQMLVGHKSREQKYNFTQEWFEDGNPDAVAARFDLINQKTNLHGLKKQSHEAPVSKSRYDSWDKQNARRRPVSAHHATFKDNRKITNTRLFNEKTELGNTMEINRLEEELAELDHLLYQRRRRR